MPVQSRNTADLKNFLDSKVALYNQPDFIESDPISIPHRFVKKQDIEISALFAAVLAWGQRVTIINKCKDLLERMDGSPYDFIVHHKASDLKRLEDFKHRTFNSTDLFYFVSFLKTYYKRHDSLEGLFLVDSQEVTVEKGLINFQKQFFSLVDFPPRTVKHISTPERKSACKRINMFLRWMVRSDQQGVDFGIWKRISPRQLVCPCDLHVERVARKLKLIKSKRMNWQTSLELTSRLREFDPLDPVKYDFALFGLGIEKKF